MKPALTVERLREVLHYEPETGAFTWLVSTAMRTKIGAVAGTITEEGYRRIKIDGRFFRAHRLAWLYVHGRWPADEIDHRFGLKDDNRIEELRELSRVGNAQNIRVPRKDNKSGYLGVSWSQSQGQWKSSIGHKKKYIHLGYFDDPKEAHQAYLKAKRELHAACTI